VDKAERDRLNIVFKIVVVVCLSLCYIVYEYTRQTNFPHLLEQCEAACKSYGRIDYVTYGRCQCTAKYGYDEKIEEKKDNLWALPRK